LPARDARQEGEQEPRADQEPGGQRGIPGSRQQDERRGGRQPGEPPQRGSGAADLVLDGEQQKWQRRRRHDRRGVSEVRDQVRAEREAEGGRERADDVGSQPARVEIRERAGEPE
jgi:hypothetical protein